MTHDTQHDNEPDRSAEDDELMKAESEERQREVMKAPTEKRQHEVMEPGEEHDA